MVKNPVSGLVRSVVIPILTVLFLLPGATVVRAQWGTDPALNLAIADRTADQVIPLVAATPDGGTCVGWFDQASGNFDVYLQLLDANGVERWPHNGVLVSDHPQNSALFGWDLIADSAGNCLVVFSDERDGGDLDIHAYKVDPDGAMVWGVDGVALSDNVDFEPAPRMAEADDGDVVVVWSRLPDAGDGEILMQRLSPAGVPQLAAGGLSVVSAAGESPGFPAVVAAGAGDVIVSWVRDISTFASPRHLRAEKFTAAGASAWGSSVDVYDAFSIPIGYAPHLRPDGAGGALMLWHRSDGSLFNSFLQHLESDGSERFAHDGVAVSTAPGLYHLNPSLTFDPVSGDTFVFWNEEPPVQNMWGLQGQRISAAGARLWSDSGSELQAMDAVFKSPPRTVAAADGAIVFYTDEPGVPGVDRLLAIRVDGAGDPAWAGSPLVVSSVASGKSRLPVTVNSSGVAAVVWEDDRDGDRDVYGQGVSPDGTLGTSLVFNDGFESGDTSAW